MGAWDGQSICIRSEKWLRSKESLCVDQENTSAGQDWKLCEFFTNDRKGWDETKVRMHFNQEDAEAIINTRIPQSFTKDMIV